MVSDNRNVAKFKNFTLTTAPENSHTAQKDINSQSVPSRG